MLQHREVFTSQETAQCMHFTGHRVAKTVIVIANSQPVVLVLPADRQVAMDRVLDLLGVESVRMATEREIREHFPDCEPGAVPPLPHWNGAQLLMDHSMKVEGNIIFQAGTHFDAVRLNYQGLVPDRPSSGRAFHEAGSEHHGSRTRHRRWASGCRR